MGNRMLKRWNSWRALIGASVLASAATVLAVGALSCCINQQTVAHYDDCPDAGASDGGDAGDNGSGGSDNLNCD